MGYSYGYNDRGNMALACDSCGNVGGVRKRTCTYKVTSEDGSTLPYCPAPALCGTCYRAEGGAAAIHAGCAEGAARSQADADRKRERIAGGDLMVLAAWGSWYETVPEGSVGVVFGAGRYVGAAEAWRLVPADRYEPGARGFLSDYPEAEAWTENPEAKTKAVTG